MVISQAKKADLEKQGYRLVGNHSAIKVCLWTKKCIRGEDVCYKNTFYGINTHRCVQMTPSFHVCTHRCQWCWRDINFTFSEWTGPVDNPDEIVDESIRQHVKYLRGFGGNNKRDEKNYQESLKPKHFAISLSGEPTFYPMLPELIKAIHKRGMTSFLVTNGTNPDVLRKLISSSAEPTQLYLTLPAPNKEVYLDSCRPLVNDSWNKILESASLFEGFGCRRTVRLTLVKNLNMVDAEGYAGLFNQIDADFFELKAYVWVGHSRDRLNIENMPRHEEVVSFANDILKFCPDLKIVAEKHESRVVCIAKDASKLKLDF